MIEIKPFVVSESLPKMVDLMNAHWTETEWDVCAQGPNPSVDMYKTVEMANQVVAFAAYDDGEMVGYITMFVYPHLHYGVMFGAHDTLVVRKDMRRGTVGIRLMSAAKTEARARGAKFIAWHAKPNSSMDLILQARHCTAAETVYLERF